MKKILIIFILALLCISVPQAQGESEQVEESVIYRVMKSYTIRNYGNHKALKENVSFNLFDNRQDLLDLSILSEEINVSGSYKEIQITETQDKRRGKVVGIEALDPGEEISIEAIYQIKVGSYPEVTRDDVEGSIPSSLEKFTEPVENVWHSDENLIKNKALELTENVSNYYFKAKNIFAFVQNWLEYSPQNVAHEDIWAYQNREGDCSEYANLFVSLARASGIPAKFVSGYHYSFGKEETSDTGLEVEGHAFACVYLPGVGWTPADPTEGPQGGGGNFGEITPEYLVEMLSDGSDMEMGNPIGVPSGYVGWTNYSGKSTSVDFVSDGTKTIIQPLAALRVEILSPIRDYPEKMEISVKVTNEGVQNASNLEVGLAAENTYFDVPSTESIQNLNPGTHEIIKFELGKKKSVEDKPVEATACYTSPDYGVLRSTEQVSISTEFSETIPSPSDFFESLKEFLVKYFYLFVVLGILVAVGVAVIRR